jgi:hypothetical protein
MLPKVNKVTARINGQLRVIAFNVKVIWRQCYELSKHMEGFYTDVVLPSEVCFAIHDSLFLPDHYLSRKKSGTSLAIRICNPQNNVDPPSHVSIEVTGFCVPTGNNELIQRTFSSI